MLKCPKCESEKLNFYNEKVYVYLTPITKNGKIPKNKKILYTEENYSKHIDCSNCNRIFDYKIDNNGKIIILEEI